MPEAAAPALEAKSGSLLFLKKFLKHGTRVASVAPSSASLAKAMCRHVTKDKPQVIVELGAGTGAVTKIIAQKMHPDSTLIAVEIDREFCNLLEKVVPQATVLRCDVLELKQQLLAMGIEKFDLMLSGLPTPSLPKVVNAAVLDCFEEMADSEGAYLTQLTVMPWVYWSMYRKIFEEVEFDLVVRNVPPGGAYHCRKLRDSYHREMPGKG